MNSLLRGLTRNLKSLLVVTNSFVLFFPHTNEFNSFSSHVVTNSFVSSLRSKHSSSGLFYPD